MRKKVLGFTLIELMIVVAIIAIIAAIAIPGLLRARIASNEGAASASLKSLVSAQTVFQKSQSVDQCLVGAQPNGTGEFGVFNEISGLSGLRGTDVLPIKQPLKISTDISAAFNIAAGNIAQKSGYNFRIWLPATGAAITDAAYTAATALPVGGDEDTIAAQEVRWICYAWPGSYRGSGVRAFVVDNSGEVFASINTNETNNTGYWEGTIVGSIPEWNSAMLNLAADPPTSVDFKGIAARDSASTVDTNHLWQPAS